MNALKYKFGIQPQGEVKMVVTRVPTHGRIAIIGRDNQSYPNSPVDAFQYTPDKDFLGDDRVSFEVTVNGKKFKINFVVKVVHGGFNDACVPDDEDRGEVGQRIPCESINGYSSAQLGA